MTRHSARPERAAPTIKPLTHLESAWRHLGGGARLDAVERAAPSLREAIRASGTVLAVRTFDIATFPYPAEYAFGGALSRPHPFVWLFNRAVLVEYKDLNGDLRRLLANPSRPEGSRKAPFFRQLLERPPRFLQRPIEKILSTQAPLLPEQLMDLGVPPASIDFITFDHLHVQEVGPLLGDAGLYPSAQLCVTRDELSAAKKLHPLQRNWYVEGAMNGVHSEQLMAFDQDILLGEGLALIRTPGHTDGNHSIVICLPSGLVTISENGVCVDCYAPHHSSIPGLRRHAETTGEKVILNSNTRERTLDQYTSMRLEAILSEPEPTDRSPWPRHFSSSELIHSPMAIGIKPTYSIEEITYGALHA